MKWIEPKVTWQRSDFINNEDYNRIINNIEYLRAMFIPLGYVYYIEHLGEVYYSREDVLNVLNSIEYNIESTANNTFRRFEYRGKREQHGNNSHWDFNDLNRIERNLLGFYETLKAVQNTTYMIPLYLGVGLNADKVVF